MLNYKYYTSEEEYRVAEQRQIKVEVDDNRKISVEAVILALFGMSIEELAKEIRNDMSGKYAGVITKLPEVKISDTNNVTSKN